MELYYPIYIFVLIIITVALGEPPSKGIIKAGCPTGTTCVPPFRCTTMMDWNGSVAPNSTRQMYRHHHCSISATFKGICCQTFGENSRSHSDGDAVNISSLFEQNTVHTRGNWLVESSSANNGRKIYERSISSYDHFSGPNATLATQHAHSRTKRCIVGMGCRNKHLRYRRYDGRCNNILPGSTLWGSAGYPMERILPPAYDNQVWTPRVLSITASQLPSARSISTLLFQDLFFPHGKYNVLMMQFGQFLVHDITKNKPFSTKVRCCHADGTHKLSNQHRACFPIEVSHDDPFYAQFGVTCLDFVRAAIASKRDCPIGHGRQISSITHFIDGSGIYGSSAAAAHELRTHHGGQLKSLKHRHSNNELPPLAEEEGDCNEKAQMCFKVGDGRVNQIITLAAFHTLFLREHNRIAQILEGLNHHWSGEIIFQEARRIVIAELQHIVFNEYLPKVLGPHLMDKYSLHGTRGYSDFYDPHTNPSVTSEFSSAAFRFGHSTIPSQLAFSNGMVNTHETFFDPTALRSPTFFDELFHGISLQPMQKIDDMFSSSVTNFLNPKKGHIFGHDLASINIQRGRDHAVQPYNQYLQLNGQDMKKDFLEFGPVLGPKLAQLYASPDDIDLYVGGILEPPVQGGIVGPTFAEIIADQFARLKGGDRYFYSNGPSSNPGHFSLPQLEEVQKSTLAAVLCANANDKQSFEIQPDAFSLPHRDNPVVLCQSDQIPKLGFNWWKD